MFAADTVFTLTILWIALCLQLMGTSYYIHVVSFPCLWHHAHLVTIQSWTYSLNIKTQSCRQWPDSVAYSTCDLVHTTSQYVEMVNDGRIYFIGGWPEEMNEVDVSMYNPPQHTYNSLQLGGWGLSLVRVVWLTQIVPSILGGRRGGGERRRPLWVRSLPSMSQTRESPAVL